MKIVAHEKSAALQEVAHLFDLAVGELPVADLHRVQPRIVEHIVAIVQIVVSRPRAPMYENTYEETIDG